MARVFTRLGKDIEIAVKAGGPDPAMNPKLRLLIQNARSENMPKENVERAIKRAVSKDSTDYKEVVYEGYGPHGIAVVVETATDNPTRTVGNVRSYFTRNGGSLGTMGMLDFLFERKCSFKVAMKEGIEIEDLELEMIDYGVEEIFVDEGEIHIYSEFTSFGPIQKYLEENHFEIRSFAFERIPNDTKALTPEQQADFDKMLERMDDDEDITNVFHNIK
ncbi:MAG: hypothetical protein FD170_774 [Bacteroidetes bacterium]|nr:MAG: hypothetical protein FD170_774 [Bacteroidota bacterium]